MNQRELRSTLIGLGDSPGTVRDTLLREHCLGTRSDSYSCPLATYLNETFPEYEFVVGPVAILYGDPEVGYDAMVIPPSPVSRFVVNYDRGFYPELEIHGS